MTTVHKIANLHQAGTDCRVFFKRPDGSIYAIVGLQHLKELKRTKMLDAFLNHQRESGVVIQSVEA